jgi:hypothetical protein
VLFHDPSPGHFSPFPHGTCSLSVTREYLGLGGGPPRFTRDFTGPVLLGIPSGSRLSFAYRGVTLYADVFQTSSATQTISYSLPDQQIRLDGPTTPHTQRLPAITRMWFGLFRFRSPLLTESRLLSLPVGTEMFHFPTFPPHTLCVQVWVTGHDSCRVSPFGNPRITARLAAPRGLSQPPTSFIGSWCQGIHRAPLLTWQIHYGCDARVHCAVLKVRAVPAVVRPIGRYNRSGPREPKSGRSLRTQQRARPADPSLPRSIPPRRAY